MQTHKNWRVLRLPGIVVSKELHTVWSVWVVYKNINTGQEMGMCKYLRASKSAM